MDGLPGVAGRGSPPGGGWEKGCPGPSPGGTSTGRTPNGNSSGGSPAPGGWAPVRPWPSGWSTRCAAPSAVTRIPTWKRSSATAGTVTTAAGTPLSAPAPRTRSRTARAPLPPAVAVPNRTRSPSVSANTVAPPGTSVPGGLISSSPSWGRPCTVRWTRTATACGYRSAASTRAPATNAAPSTAASAGSVPSGSGTAGPRRSARCRATVPDRAAPPTATTDVRSGPVRASARARSRPSVSRARARCTTPAVISRPATSWTTVSADRSARSGRAAIRSSATSVRRVFSALARSSLAAVRPGRRRRGPPRRAPPCRTRHRSRRAPARAGSPGKRSRSRRREHTARCRCLPRPGRTPAPATRADSPRAAAGPAPRAGRRRAGTAGHRSPVRIPPVRRAGRPEPAVPACRSDRGTRRTPRRGRHTGRRVPRPGWAAPRPAPRPAARPDVASRPRRPAPPGGSASPRRRRRRVRRAPSSAFPGHDPPHLPQDAPAFALGVGLRGHRRVGTVPQLRHDPVVPGPLL